MDYEQGAYEYLCECHALVCRFWDVVNAALSPFIFGTDQWNALWAQAMQYKADSAFLLALIQGDTI